MDFFRTAPNKLPTFDDFQGPPKPPESEKRSLKGHLDDQLLLLFATNLNELAKTQQKKQSFRTYEFYESKFNPPC